MNHTAFFPQSVASNSIDIGIYNGRFISALPPGSAILSAPFGGLGILLDKRFTLTGYERLFDEGFVAICASAASFYTYGVSRIFWGPSASLLCCLALDFGSLVWPYATVFFQHDIALPFVVRSLYLVFDAKTKRRGVFAWFSILLRLHSYAFCDASTMVPYKH